MLTLMLSESFQGYGANLRKFRGADLLVAEVFESPSSHRVRDLGSGLLFSLREEG